MPITADYNADMQVHISRLLLKIIVLHL